MFAQQLYLRFDNFDTLEAVGPFLEFAIESCESSRSNGARDMQGICEIQPRVSPVECQPDSVDIFRARALERDELSKRPEHRPRR